MLLIMEQKLFLSIQVSMSAELSSVWNKIYFLPLQELLKDVASSGVASGHAGHAIACPIFSENCRKQKT